MSSHFYDILLLNMDYIAIFTENTSIKPANEFTIYFRIVNIHRRYDWNDRKRRNVEKTGTYHSRENQQ